MGSDDGRLWITYNGEVYNAPELRQALIGLGHHFRSSSDTEVVLAAYREWGQACLDRFNGMFAFAIWDEREQALFGARDRFGIKPFYYRQDAGRFLFASEIKALLCDPSFPRRAYEPAVYDFLAQGKQDHTTETFFSNIHQLAPGEWLTVRAGTSEGARFARGRWWNIASSTRSVSAQEAVARTRELIEDSVRLELRADVPVGSCLSGGLDSSTIVCLMAGLLNGKPAPQTFSSCHDDPRFDERRYIRSVLAKTRVLNREIFPDPVRLWDKLPDILWHQDEPVAGTSVLAQWAVMEAAGQAGVKVLLDGQGGDELLLGYPRYVGYRLADLLRAGYWREGVREYQAWRSVHGGLHPTAVAAAVRGLLPDTAARWLRRHVTHESAWLAPGAEQMTSTFTSVAGSSLARHAAQVLLQDLPALLHYEDRSAMAFSVEARVPFLDHRLVEWLMSLPPELKLYRGVTKVVLRDAMAGILPEEVRVRTDKMGFVTPEDQWLRVTWREQIEGMLDSSSLKSRPYWRAPGLKRLYQGYCEGKAGVGPIIWRCLSVEAWLRKFCD
jgi:asparagine synthase (glutamine-hydrolysing)